MFRDAGGTNLSRRKPSTTFVNTLKSLSDPRLTGWIAPALVPWANSRSTTVITDRYGYEYTVQSQDIADDVNHDALDGVFPDYPVGDTYVGISVGHISTNPTRYGGTDSPFPKAGAFNNFRVSSFSDLFAEDASDLMPMSLMQACEVNLCLAEAAQKGWISGSAKTFYDKGITLNMQRWEIPAEEIDTYLANPLVSLNGTNNIEKIATQKWLALFTNGVEGYFDFRRTGLPSSITAAVPSLIVDKFPLRWRYPAPELSNNAKQVAEATSRQGGDTQFTKMWLLK